MIFVKDNFFDEKTFDLVNKEIRKLEFFDKEHDPHVLKDAVYPGYRTADLVTEHVLLDNFIIRQIEQSGSPFVNGTWEQHQYAYMRLGKDEAGEYRHQDPYDWAYVIYMSKTNLNSGTKLYESLDETKDDEVANVRFVQNRVVMFNSDIPHRSWGNHGKDFTDGRLTINGFAFYT